MSYLPACFRQPFPLRRAPHPSSSSVFLLLLDLVVMRCVCARARVCVWGGRARAQRGQLKEGAGLGQKKGRRDEPAAFCEIIGANGENGRRRSDSCTSSFYGLFRVPTPWRTLLSSLSLSLSHVTERCLYSRTPWQPPIVSSSWSSSSLLSLIHTCARPGSRVQF